MAKQWLAAINGDADWVQIVTWNDWYESSYVAPINSTKLDTGPKQLPNNTMPSHTAYLSASKYYIDWFKTGIKPKIKSDEVYYFYRLHPKTVKASILIGKPGGEQDYPRGSNKLIDNIYVRAYLKSPASIEIKSGEKIRKFDVEAGAHDISMPFELGSQNIKLIRANKIIWSQTGEKEITLDPTARFNYLSGGGKVPE